RTIVPSHCGRHLRPIFPTSPGTARTWLVASPAWAWFSQSWEGAPTRSPNTARHFRFRIGSRPSSPTSLTTGRLSPAPKQPGHSPGAAPQAAGGGGRVSRGAPSPANSDRRLPERARISPLSRSEPFQPRQFALGYGEVGGGKGRASGSATAPAG